MTFDSEVNPFRSCEWLGSRTSARASAGAQNPSTPQFPSSTATFFITSTALGLFFALI